MTSRSDQERFPRAPSKDTEPDCSEVLEALREYGRHDPGCSAEIDEERYPCKCGWTRVRRRMLRQ